MVRPEPPDREQCDEEHTADVGGVVRTAVYNRYWSTGGGAEKYGGVIAQVLSGDGPLDLLTHDPVDIDWLAERLHLDLAKVDVRIIDDEPGKLTRASDDYDLFVNVSYMSSDRSATPRSLYVVHFPTPLDAHLGPISRFVTRRSDRLVHALVPVEMEWGDGFHHRDPGSRGISWTNGEGVLRFVTEPTRPVTVTFVFGHHRPARLGPASVRIEVDGEAGTALTLSPAASRVQGLRGAVARVRVTSPAAGVPVEVRIISDTFVPSEVLGGDDRRRLGVPLKALHVGSGRWGVVTRYLPTILESPASARWAKSYGALVSNSAFTQGWVKRWWECDSEVLYPPVRMHAAGDKKPMILNVGRFFDSDRGHSKKQLEMVETFRQLCDRGVKGWSLHLVGGCAPGDRPYLERVREAARGYPVSLHVDASGEELESLYGQASIYWHASGLGENANKQPDRLEHFGITTVEAMSAGAVPIVIGLAGQRETVRHSIDGYHFHTLDELAALTESLIRDDERRATMAESAQARAEDFSTDAFEIQLRRIIERL